MNLATAVVLAILVVFVALSVRTFRIKGTCGYKEHCSGHCNPGSAECDAAKRMVENMDRDLASHSM
ncbi:hypothetical protein [Slackia heliotrinireducens]|uniref:Virus attachment protein p12 family n=1 Tax=Slackia heliotrinireducens (strain ATCC 29202 / DSM 20476 / NCTC 11029 / RHS 1) TaxID=471855 RepID=C7N7Y3_SLAHD|nr:hypothetical protein [Slackia heliotrinireducens]ACV23018.1 hypothetical protein Shel_20040 [Slackia heliotrinireducens DSM 20476]VEH01929.1 Uncharacterised protein [Slackia heliotrinireducens]